MTTASPDAAALSDLVEELRFAAGAYDSAVQKAVSSVIDRPLPSDERRSLLTAVYTHLKASPAVAADETATAELAGEIDGIVRRAMERRERASDASGGRRALRWKTYAGYPRPVHPRPRFHGKEIELVEGFVDISELHAWPENDRLEIHVSAFRREHGRAPDADELIRLLLSEIELPGVTRADEFQIKRLADSIAANGVRVPPIVDHWGVPQDGNRRLAACQYILNHSGFDNEAKERARTIRVWKMSEFADADDYRAVVIGLNFEPSEKIDWPEYIKARRVAEDWDRMLAAEGSVPNQTRRTELRKQLAARFVIDTGRVDRYLKMVDWADRFEEHHRDLGRGEEEVQQKASEWFQYFAEMSIGKGEGGVAYTLTSDEQLRSLTFDLLYDGKIKAFPLVRELPKVARSPEARELLVEAAAMPVTGDDPKRDPMLKAAREKVADAVAKARAEDAEIRAAGADQKIKTFVSWLRKVPVDVFEDRVETKTLRDMVEAFDLTMPLVRRALEQREA